MKPPVDVSNVSSVMAKIIGLRITDGKETEEGLRFELEGGQVLIFTGAMIIALYGAQLDKSIH